MYYYANMVRILLPCLALDIVDKGTTGWHNVTLSVAILTLVNFRFQH